MKKIYYSIAVILLLILAAAGVVYKFYPNLIHRKADQKVQVDTTPLVYTKLWDSESFKNAGKLTREGKYNEALEEYNKLTQSDLSKEDAITRSQLNVRIATLLDIMGEKQKAVSMLNRIATDKNEYFITRSFAYQYMAQMVYETRDPAILDIVEKTTNIGAQGADRYTLVSQQLLQQSELVAPLYLGLTEKMKIDLQTIMVFTPENTKAIRYNLGTIDKMIPDILKEKNVGYMLPLALLRKAQVAERIEASGNYGLPKTVEQYYQEAQKAYDQYSDARSYNYVYYEYARYLANKDGANRKADVEKLLAHYSDNVPEKNNLKTLLANISKNGQTPLQLKELKQVYKIAPGFKL